MKLKKIVFLILLTLSMLSISGCQYIEGGPTQTINKFFNLTKKSETDKVKELMSKKLADDYLGTLGSQKTILTSEEQLSIEELKEIEGYEEFQEKLNELSSKLSFEVIDKNISDNKAEFNIEITYVNLSKPIMKSMNDIFSQMLGSVFLGKEMNEEDMMKLMFTTLPDNINDDELELSRAIGKIELQNIDNEWLITNVDENISNALMFGLVDDLGSFGEDLFNNVDLDEIELETGK